MMSFNDLYIALSVFLEVAFREEGFESLQGFYYYIPSNDVLIEEASDLISYVLKSLVVFDLFNCFSGFTGFFMVEGALVCEHPFLGI